jgi:hypothetical protein
MSSGEVNTSVKANGQADLVETYKRLFSSEDGQRVLFDLMHQGYFLRPTIDGQGYETSLRNEGGRELVLYIIENLNREPAEILDFIKKYEEERKRELGDYDID